MKNYARPDLSWILDELVDFPGARNAVVLSADGMRMTASHEVTVDLADNMSAVASGMQSLSRNAASFVGPGAVTWHQTMVQYDGGYLFLVAASATSYLVTSASSDVDVLAFSDRMASVVERLGASLAAESRQRQDELA
ncbi:roadblock/LC7 domain-containing protein [Streptomyces roseus]|uniref:roadblock/LC7 domain-containing protein n=1 Tax=Streptomyces TaxID=1883 RepID=UPI000765ACCE|nr:MULTISPECIES: roadblock/LC7 domain-containing protein [Streptomyces]